jgi:hypothetical protein
MRMCIMQINGVYRFPRSEFIPIHGVSLRHKDHLSAIQEWSVHVNRVSPANTLKNEK